MPILSGRWSRHNRAALVELLTREFKHPPIAVFEWDHTCIDGDLASAIFHYLCASLAFKFEAPGFWDWVNELDVKGEIPRLYKIHRHDASGDDRMRLRMCFERVRNYARESDDDVAAWAWDSGAFVGWTVDQVRGFAGRVIQQELARGFEKEALMLTGESPVQIQWGLREREEMRELIGVMQRADWRVWIMSGSPRWELEVFAARYGIPAERLVAMQRAVVAGKITVDLEPPAPYSDGKLGAYYQAISRTQAPALVAGYGVGDWKLFESAEHVRLLIEPIADSLREFASWRETAGETWLLQKFE